MYVTADMKVKEALKLSEYMIDAFVWLSPDFERLYNPEIRRVVGERASIEQVARMACVPVAEALYVLNLVAGEDEKLLSCELNLLPVADFRYEPENPSRKPRELRGLHDEDPNVHFVDVVREAMSYRDARPHVMRELEGLQDGSEVLLVRHAFDPIMLRDELAERGYASWAEERRPHDWYVYFYKPRQRSQVTVH